MAVTEQRVGFALEELTPGDDGLLEVVGTWSGVRGMRFVRPALVVRDPESGEERTLLAALDDKPWDPTGKPWRARFPWTGGAPDPALVELAVAPSVVVPLKDEGRFRRDGREPAAVKLRRRVGEDAERLRRLESEVEFLRGELEARVAERDAARHGRDEAVAERDAALRARDEAVAERDTALRAREVGRQAAAELQRARDEALRERDEARAASSEADRGRDVAARDAGAVRELRRERDRLGRELEESRVTLAGAEREREELRDRLAEAERSRESAAQDAHEERRQRRDRERLARDLDAARAALAEAERERDEALARPAGVVPRAPVADRRHERASAHADWAARIAALLAVVILLVLLITFMRAM